MKIYCKQKNWYVLCAKANKAADMFDKKKTDMFDKKKDVTNNEIKLMCKSNKNMFDKKKF